MARGAKLSRRTLGGSENGGFRACAPNARRSRESPLREKPKEVWDRYRVRVVNRDLAGISQMGIESRLLILRKRIAELTKKIMADKEAGRDDRVRLRTRALNEYYKAREEEINRLMKSLEEGSIGRRIGKFKFAAKQAHVESEWKDKIAQVIYYPISLGRHKFGTPTVNNAQISKMNEILEAETERRWRRILDHVHSPDFFGDAKKQEEVLMLGREIQGIRNAQNFMWSEFQRSKVTPVQRELPLEER